MSTATGRLGAFCIGVALSCAMLGLSRTASATPQQEQEARSLFLDARDAMSRGEFATACPMLEQSVRLHEGLGTQFNLAHCWEKLGKKAAAWSLFREVADGANANGETKRAEVAARRAIQLVASLNYIVLQLPKSPERLSVSLGGKLIPRQRWGVPLPLDPGDYPLRVSADGFKSFNADIQLSSDSGTVEVNVPALEPADETEREVAASSVSRSETALVEDETAVDVSGTSWATWALVGGGAVAVTGLVYGLTASGSAKEASQRADEQCPASRTEGCTAEEVSNYDHYVGEQRAWSQRALVGYGIAAAATASLVGIILLADWDQVDGRETTVMVDVQPTGGGAWVRHEF